MDRQKVDELPSLQVQFFESTGIPVFKASSTQVPFIEINFSDTCQFSSNNPCLYLRLLWSMQRGTLILAGITYLVI